VRCTQHGWQAVSLLSARIARSLRLRGRSVDHRIEQLVEWSYSGALLRFSRWLLSLGVFLLSLCFLDSSPTGSLKTLSCSPISLTGAAARVAASLFHVSLVAFHVSPWRITVRFSLFPFHFHFHCSLFTFHVSLFGSQSVNHGRAQPIELGRIESGNGGTGSSERGL
jgi:hypothetical protein